MTPNTSRASWWPRRTRRNKISLSKNLNVKKRLRPKWVFFLMAKKTLLVIKYPFKSRHQHQSTTNCWGRAKKSPENLVYQKCIRIRAEKATSRAS